MSRRAGDAAVETLGRRALNRALLARQLLLERADLTPEAALERLVGLQAQDPQPPYTGLWSRLAEFRPEDLSELIGTRRAVRIVLMRGTIHLVTARDALALRPVVQPVLDRWFFAAAGYSRNLYGVDLAALVAAGRALLEERPRTLTDLGPLLQSRWPDRDARSLTHAIRALAPLVQVPPRSLWREGGAPLCTTAESWLGRPLGTETAPDGLILRYLGAFGPASVADAQAWSGLPGLRDALERLRPRLVSFRDERGRELFDLPDAPRPDPATPAPARLIAEFDNLTLSHADRLRIIADDHRRRIGTKNGMIPGMILVDGFVAGTWRIARTRAAATLTIAPFAPLAAADRLALEEEGARLLAFAAADLSAHEVVFVAPG